MRKIKLKTKRCTRCGERKRMTEFHRDKGREDGRCTACKDCCKEYYQKNREERRAYDKNYYRENKEKKREQQKKYYQENREEIREYNKKYYQENREEKREYHKKYYQENREELNRKQRKYLRDRYQNDIQYNLSMKYRTQAKDFLKSHKTKHSIEYLGCTWEELKQYLQSQFTNGMTWEKVLNGEIHIDHIYPLSKVDLTDEKECGRVLHYTNLQPLWAEDNLKKGDTILTQRYPYFRNTI